MKKMIAFFLLKLLKVVFSYSIRNTKTQPIFVKKVIDVANLSIGKGFAGKSTIQNEVSAIASILDPNKENTLVDVGANKGVYSNELLNKFKKSKLILFEPNLDNYKYLEKRFSNYKNINIEKLGLSNTNSKNYLYSDLPGSGLASLSQRNLEHFNLELSYREEIDVVRFEDYWSKNLNIENIDLLKLDIEGHELDALYGCGEKLKKIKIIQFEFGGCNIDSKTYFQNFWYFFKNTKFKLFRLSPYGMIEVKEYSEKDEYFLTTNYLAVDESIL